MSKKTIYLELLKEEKELLATLEQVRGLLKHYKDIYDFKDEKSNPVIETVQKPLISSDEKQNEFDNEWIYRDKVLFVLKSLGGKAKSSDVRDKWIELDSTISEERANTVTRKQLWELENTGVITSKKTGSGRTKIYVLK